MKNKYQRMNKDEKKQLRLEYKNSERGKNQLPRLNRLIITGILGIVFTIIMLIYSVFNNPIIWDYAYAGLLALASIIFIIGSILIRNKEYCKFATKKK